MPIPANRPSKSKCLFLRGKGVVRKTKIPFLFYSKYAPDYLPVSGLHPKVIKAGGRGKVEA
jgi:hypothetical protein